MSREAHMSLVSDKENVVHTLGVYVNNKVKEGLLVKDSLVGNVDLVYMRILRCTNKVNLEG